MSYLFSICSSFVSARGDNIVDHRNYNETGDPDCNPVSHNGHTAPYNHGQTDNC
jgi:hypothetical protein